MPIQRGPVTFVRYRIRTGPKEKRALSNGLRKRAFEPIDRASDQDRVAGWVELENSDSAELTPSTFLFGERLLVKWRVDKLIVPGRLLRTEVEKWRRSFSEREGRAPTRGESRDQKALIQQELRSRAFIRSDTHDVSWDLQRDELWIWTTSKGLLDEIIDALEAMGIVMSPLSPGARVETLDPKLIEPTEALHHLTRENA